MLITEGLGEGQLLITEGFGISELELEIGADRPLGDRIVRIGQAGVPKIVGNRLSDRGTKMQEAA